MEPDDPEAKIKFLAAEALRGVGAWDSTLTFGCLVGCGLSVVVVLLSCCVSVCVCVCFMSSVDKETTNCQGVQLTYRMELGDLRASLNVRNVTGILQVTAKSNSQETHRFPETIHRK